MTRYDPNNRYITTRIALAAVLLGGATWQAPSRADELTRIKVSNPSEKTVRRAPVTIGQAFRRGDVQSTVAVHVGDAALPAQIDVKRRYDDGSVRLAIVSAFLDELPPAEKVALAFSDGKAAPPRRAAVSAAELLGTDFDTVVTLKFPEGTVRSLSARKLLQQAGDRATTWLRGPVATEWLLSGPPVDQNGVPDEDLAVQFQVRAYAGCDRVRVSVVVENCWDRWAGNVRYDATVTLCGREVFARAAVDHRKLSRWRKVFWTGTDGEPDVHVAHDLAYLSATGALPNYDQTLPPQKPSSAQEAELRMEGPRWQIMGRGSLTAYMPTTGGRPEIAPYPTWTVRYLLGMDPRAKDSYKSDFRRAEGDSPIFALRKSGQSPGSLLARAKALVLANGDLAGSWPIHVRARQTGRIMTIDQRPKFWLDQRGEDRPAWKPDRHAPDPAQTRLTPDLAHQGSFAYVPYLVTGDYYYLEEAHFWANYCLLATWPHPRREAEGILSGQIRGNAWSLRNLADAAWIATDGDPEAAYFDQKVRNNLADRIRRMYGPPEYNKRGFWGIRTTQSARIQNPANPDWMIIAPWEHDYLMWSLHHLVELGYVEAARPRDFLLRWRVGTLTNAPDFDPRLAAPYRFVIGEQRADKQVHFYEDWKPLSRENARLSRPSLPDPGNNYAYSARAAVVCGVDGRFPQATDALRWIEAQFPDLRQRMARDPSWAIVPRRAADP